MSERVMRVGMLGCGTVGAAVVRLLEHADDIERRAGCRLEMHRWRCATSSEAARRRRCRRGVHRRRRGRRRRPRDRHRLRAARRARARGELVLAALERGKPVVTANKELLATRGRELFDAADAQGLDLVFEAAVAGGIPLIRPLKESLAGERVTPGDRHRERHDELHPHADVRGGCGLRRRARRGAAARVRRGRSHRRRRGLRRGGQVRDPRVDRVRRPGRRGRRLPRGDRGRDRPGHRRRAPGSATS